MTTTQILTLAITLSFAFLIAVFRNSLASMGDEIIRQIGKIGKLLFNIFWALSGFVFPVYKLFITYDATFSKEWVSTMLFYSLSLFFNIVVLMLLDHSNMNRKLRAANRGYLDAVMKSLKWEILKGRIEDIEDNGKTTSEVISKLSELRKKIHEVTKDQESDALPPN